MPELPKIFGKIPSVSELLASASDYMPFIPKPAPKYVSESGKPVHGITAEFSKTPVVVRAAEKVRDAGYTRWDVMTPFPIHGMETSMGIKRTILPALAAGAALTGVAGALAMQLYMNNDFEMVVQGKPFLSWEPLTPITFEIGILLTAFTCVFGMMALNGLPRFHHPLFNSERFLSVSDNRFFVCIEASDPKFDPVRTRELLESAGADRIELVEDEN